MTTREHVRRETVSRVLKKVYADPANGDVPERFKELLDALK